MVKKNSEAFDLGTEPVREAEVLAADEQEETLYETDAYIAPETDPGANVTITKTIGRGGPVPIVAPRHDTIQLQPIIVPLAVVPYMSQDSAMLRTEGTQRGTVRSSEYAEPVYFEPVNAKKDKNGAKNRIYVTENM